MPKNDKPYAINDRMKIVGGMRFITIKKEIRKLKISRKPLIMINLLK